MFSSFSKMTMGTAIVIGMILLSACHAKKPQLIPPPPPPYGFIGFDLVNLKEELIAANVQIIRQGDRLRMIFPVYKFFNIPSLELKPNKIATVKAAAYFVKRYIQRYRHPKIEILGFSDKVYGEKTRAEVSKQYALTIASYLWNAGIPRSQMIIRGLGSTQSIATYRTPVGNAMNRRVEIRINFSN